MQEFVGQVSGANIRMHQPPDALPTGGRIEAQASFLASHAGFQGHFPGRPILPGFLQIQLVLDLLHLCGKPNGLSAIHGAKFLQPILPDQSMDVALECISENTIRAAIHVAGVPASVMELEIAAAGSSQNR
jgi:3-hydroxyacyl-[acyl-carrier-protein] dehydratase